MLIKSAKIVSIEEQEGNSSTVERFLSLNINPSVSACCSCVSKSSCYRESIHLTLQQQGLSSDSRLSIEEFNKLNSNQPLLPGATNIGDQVSLEFDEKALLRLSVLFYFTPIFIMLLAAGVASFFELSESMDILVVLMGLALGFLVIKAISLHNTYYSTLKPRVLFSAN